MISVCEHSLTFQKNKILLQIIENINKLTDEVSGLKTLLFRFKKIHKNSKLWEQFGSKNNQQTSPTLLAGNTVFTEKQCLKSTMQVKNERIEQLEDVSEYFQGKILVN